MKINIQDSLRMKEFVIRDKDGWSDSEVIESVLESINKLEYGDVIAITLFKNMNK